MVITAPENLLRTIQQERERLLRLYTELVELKYRISGNQESTENYQQCKEIEIEMRKIAANLVYRIDLAFEFFGSESLLGLTRSTRRSLEQASRLMYPESIEKYLLLVFAHHLETSCGNRQAPSEESERASPSPAIP